MLHSTSQPIAYSRPTHFERLIRWVHSLPAWHKGLLVLGLLALPFVVAYLEGMFRHEPLQDRWRTLLFPTAVLLYVIAVAPHIWRAEQAVVAGLRPLAAEAVSDYDAQAHRVGWHSSRGDWRAFGVGLVAGILLYFQREEPDRWYWVYSYLMLLYLLMYGGLGWLIYTAMSSARLTALLHKYIQHKDPFYLSPFEPVGWQGLSLALIFVGLITLALLLGYSPSLFLYWQAIAILSILILVTISLFFAVMWPTHRMLQQVKEQKIISIQHLIGQTFAKLDALAAGELDTQPVATEVQAWLALEQRLNRIRTWPYDTEMLRTLFLSVLTPIAVGIARLVGVYLTEGHF
jgi:hypothetical protein